MGADLYIKKMDREKQIFGYEVSEKAVDAGYFRDCYNSGGLFAKLGLSWWKTYDEYGLDKTDGEMDVKDILHFKEKVIEAKENYGNMDKEYNEWYNLLIRFLDRAIELNSQIIFSV